MAASPSSRRRSLGLVAAVLLAALGALWLWIGTRPAGESADGTSEELALGPVAGAASALGEAPASAERATATPAPVSSGSVATPRLADDSPGRFEVLVLRGSSSDPVEGAEVHALEVPGFTWWEHAGQDQLVVDPEGELVRRGVRATTDARGIALCAEPRSCLVVCARTGDEFAVDAIQAGAIEPHALTLRLQHELRVVVRTADGRAASGASVGFGPAEETYLEWSARTDESGELRIRNFESIVSILGREDARAFTVRLDVPVEPPIERWIDPAHPPQEPIDFRLPACGSIEVRTLDCHGRPMALDGRVLVQPLRRPGEGGFLPATQAVEARADLVLGRALVPCVESGRTFDVTVLPEGGGVFSIAEAGPEVPGQTVVLELRAPETILLVRGRALDAGRRPLAQLELGLHSARDYEQNGWLRQLQPRTMRTDEDGRFRVVLRLAPVQQRQQPWRLRAWIVAPREDRPALRAELSGGIAHGAGSVDVGDVVLGEPELLLAGRIVDEREEPVAGLEVRLARVVPRQGATAITGARCETGTDGSFAFHGTCTPHALRVFLPGGDVRIFGQEVEREFACGATDARLHVERFGRVEGLALVDPEHCASAPPLVLTDGERQEGDLEAWRAPGGWRFRFRNVAAGVVALQVVDFAKDGAPLLSIPNLVVSAGETLRDPRLAPFDLRGRLPRRDAAAEPGEVTVLDLRGQRAERGLFWFSSEEFESNGAFLDGRIRLAAEEREGDVAAWAPGHRLTRLGIPAQEPILRLLPALSVRLHLDLPDALRKAGVRATVAIEVGDEGSDDTALLELMDRAQPLALDGRGEVVIELPAPGPWAANVTFTRGSGADEHASEVHVGIAVRDIDGEQRVPVEIQAGAWQTVLEDLGLGPEGQ